MPIDFQLEQRLGGFTAHSARKDEQVSLICRELLGPDDPLIFDRLDKLQSCLFSKIPQFPAPPGVNDLVIVINQDLNGRRNAARL
jgi:hypothetical protein